MDSQFTSWTTLKSYLNDKNLLSPNFSKKSTNSTYKPIHRNPLLIASNFDGIQKLVERGLGLRKEVRELEVLAVRAAADFDLFTQTSLLEEQSEILRLFAVAKDKDRSANHIAAEHFSSGVTPLEKGLAAISNGRQDSLSSEVLTSGELETRVKQRWGKIRDYQNAYQMRYHESGNAHNYGERAGRAQLILNSYLDELGDRIAAFVVGMHTVYGLKLPSPSLPVDVESLDSIVLWILDAKRYIDALKDQEITTEMVVPLVQPWLGGAVISKKKFDDAILSSKGSVAKLDFTISSDCFLGSNVRLTGFGLAFGNVFSQVTDSGLDSAQVADSFARLTARISPPIQNLADGGTHTPRPFVIGNISLHQFDRPSAFVDGPLLENINPVGDWSIEILPWMVWKDENEMPLRDGILGERIRDLKLLFRVFSPGIA